MEKFVEFALKNIQHPLKKFTKEIVVLLDIFNGFFFIAFRLPIIIHFIPYLYIATPSTDPEKTKLFIYSIFISHILATSSENILSNFSVHSHASGMN